MEAGWKQATAARCRATAARRLAIACDGSSMARDEHRQNVRPPPVAYVRASRSYPSLPVLSGRQAGMAWECRPCLRELD